MSDAVSMADEFQGCVAFVTGPLRGSAAQQTVSLGSEARALRRAAARSFTANPGLQRGKGLRCPCVAHLSARYRAVLAKTRLECLIRERTHRGL